VIRLERAVDAVDRAVRTACYMLVAGIACVMLAQVFFRYVLNSSLQWAEELSVYAMIWLVFLGSVNLVRGWSHITITAFVNMLPFRVRTWAFVLAKVLSLVFIVVLCYWGVQLVSLPVHAASPSMGFSTRWVKVAVAVGAALMALFIVSEVRRDLAALRKGDREHFTRLGTGGEL
jgi:TRAP-type C4-dicarboxylate transport system permease small subunit